MAKLHGGAAAICWKVGEMGWQIWTAARLGGIWEPWERGGE
jgi:hypothetical protein